MKNKKTILNIILVVSLYLCLCILYKRTNSCIIKLLKININYY